METAIVYLGCIGLFRGYRVYNWDNGKSNGKFYSIFGLYWV